MGLVNPAKAALPYRDKFVVQTSQKAALKAAMIIKDELHAIPLDKKKKILLINQQNSIKSPNDAYDHPALFQELMENDWPTLQTFETQFGYNEKEDAQVIKFVEDNQFDLIICTNFYDRQEKPHLYPKALIDKGYPVVLVTILQLH